MSRLSKLGVWFVACIMFWLFYSSVSLLSVHVLKMYAISPVVVAGSSVVFATYVLWLAVKLTVTKRVD